MSSLERNLEELANVLKMHGFPVVLALQPGLNKERIENELDSVSLQLPGEASILYGWHNGTNLSAGYSLSEVSLIGGMYHFLSLKDAIRYHRETSRNVRLHESWFPLMSNDFGDLYLIPTARSVESTASTAAPEGLQALDPLSRDAIREVADLQSQLAPTLDGYRAPVIEFVHDDPDFPWPVIAYRDITTMILTLIECYRQAAYVYSTDKRSVDVDYLLEQEISAKHNPGLDRWQREIFS